MIGSMFAVLVAVKSLKDKQDNKPTMDISYKHNQIKIRRLTWWLKLRYMLGLA